MTKPFCRISILGVLFATLFGLRGQPIDLRQLTPGVPMKITLSPELATTLLFPSQIAGTFGLGLVQGGAQRANAGSVQLEHPEGSSILVLHALTETARVLMTVLMDGQLYVFQLEAGREPDVAITLTKSEPSVARAQEVTPEEVKAARLKYDPELLVGFERRAHDAALLRKLYPDLYQGYSARPAQYSSDNGKVKTTVTEIHRFSKEDAVVLEGTVTNELPHPIDFDGRAATVEVANEVHPVKLLDCLRPIPVGATVPVVAVIQGDIDGSRANLSIDNEFRILVGPVAGEATAWDLKNGGPRDGKFKVPAPLAPANVPLTQTNKAMKEPQP
jgi:hypothetical protein